MKPFLLLSSRDDDDATAGEYAAFARFGELDPADLHQIRLEKEPLPDIDLNDYSGIIIGGSQYNFSDLQETKSDVQRRVEAELSALLDRVVEADFPVLGACYGVGTLGAHQGATIDDTYSEPVSGVTVQLTAAGRADPLLEGMPDEFDAYVGHKEAVCTAPDHVTVLASSGTCPVQMFRVKQNLYATQFHPELDLDGILTRIQIYKHHGYFPAEEAEEVSDTARASHVWAPGRVLRNFVLRYARA
jgi:GMP synthase (glutamine-hydrolysing)